MNTSMKLNVLAAAVSAGITGMPLVAQAVLLDLVWLLRQGDPFGSGVAAAALAQVPGRGNARAAREGQNPGRGGSREGNRGRGLPPGGRGKAAGTPRPAHGWFTRDLVK